MVKKEHHVIDSLTYHVNFNVLTVWAKLGMWTRMVTLKTIRLCIVEKVCTIFVLAKRCSRTKKDDLIQQSVLQG